MKLQIGPRYASVTLDTFRQSTARHRAAVEIIRAYLGKLPEHIEHGRGLVLHGPRGTGKDHLAVAALREAARALFSVSWIDGQGLFSEMRDAIGKDGNEAEFVKQFTAPQILLISDPVPQEGKLTEFQQSTMWRVIDRRYRDMKPTWVTVNCKDESELIARLGAQIVDRLTDDAIVLPTVGWESFRKPHQVAK